MKPIHAMPEIAQNIRTVRKEIKLVRKLIQQRIDKLLWINTQKIPGSQPFMRMEHIRSTEEWCRKSKINLSNPSSYREELRQQIEQLKRLLKNLQTSQRKLHAKNIRSQIGRTRQKIGRSLREFEKKIIQSEDDPEMWNDIHEMARRNTHHALSQLKTNPSRQNVKVALSSFSDEIAMGICEGERYFSINETINNAVKERLQDAEERFRRIPSVENFIALFREVERAQRFLGDAQPEHAGWKPANDVVHKVKKGDTLSGLSKKYYGKTYFWDIIFLKNAHLFDSNFRLLPKVQTIIIP